MMPFAGGMTETTNGSLILSVAAALLYLLMVQQPPSWRRTVAKTGSIVLLGVVSYSAGGPMLLTLALLASASGDAALAAEEERWFLPGLVAFLIAHLLYVALFAIGSEGIGLLWDEPWRSVWALLILLAARSLLVPLLRAVPAAMRLPIVFYTLAIVAMGVMALTLPGHAVAIGATLFIASDAILAIRKYLLPETSPHAAWTGYGVWVLYYAAQLAITLAIVA
ncbi:MAG: lysoplasmalogenase [Rhizobiaceae bacterium]|nr:lysoplasmalogenase [Rhizobiaceae bacterium]